MSRENTFWLVVFLIGAVLLGVRAMMAPDGLGKAYVREVPVLIDAEHPDGRWNNYENATFTDYQKGQAGDPEHANVQFSISRSIGIWLAAFFTLAVLSFLVKDNPFYKIAESVFVGISAAYWMVVAFWTSMLPNLFAQLTPGLVRQWSTPDLSPDASPDLWFIIPLILSVMLLWRLAPVGAWISRWPTAFFIGIFCGWRLIRFLHADFLSQIRNSVVSVWGETPAGTFSFWESLEAILLFIGVMACLVYFFFSIEHKGMVGRTARLGIWFLMITFGAGFGYTVMGRIALLAIRIEFLFDDWLWLIDPTGKRIVEVAEVTTGVLWPMVPMIW